MVRSITSALAMAMAISLSGILSGCDESKSDKGAPAELTAEAKEKQQKLIMENNMKAQAEAKKKKP